MSFSMNFKTSNLQNVCPNLKNPSIKFKQDHFLHFNTVLYLQVRNLNILASTNPSIIAITVPLTREIQEIGLISPILTTSNNNVVTFGPFVKTDFKKLRLFSTIYKEDKFHTKFQSPSLYWPFKNNVVSLCTL